MVVAQPVDYLRVVVVNTLAYLASFPEVKWRTSNIFQFSNRYQLFVYRNILRCMQDQFMIKYVSLGITGEVEVCVIGQVDNCWLVSCRAVIDAELIVIGQRIDHLLRQITGISLFHTRTEISEANCLTLLRRYGF